MFWIALLVQVALTFGQVPGLVKQGVYKEHAFTEALAVSNHVAPGREAYHDQLTSGHPHVALLRGVNPPGIIESNCAGSVVHRNWVLTAAKCTARRTSLVVRVGVNDFTTVPDYIYETTEWWVHPRFNLSFPSSSQANDISIIKLQRAFTYSKLVQPIRLQPSAEAFADYDNVVFIANGLRWTDGDSPEVRNWAYFLGISNRECSGVFGTVLITNTAVCAKWNNVSLQSSCRPIQNNGGSLWYLDSDGVPVLLGINSFWQNDQCNNAARLAGFTRTGPFHGWLTEITGLDFENLNEEDEVTEVPEPLTTETSEPSTTKAPIISSTARPVPLTTEALETPTTETFKPSTTEVPEPPSTEDLETPTTETSKPPSTEASKPDSKESDEDFNDSDSSESKEDPELSELFNKLQVKVKVKVKVNNNLTLKK